MRKVGILFILAVFLPSLGLAWLALRSITAQELQLERQAQLIHEQAAEKVAADCREKIGELQEEFGEVIETLLKKFSEAQLSSSFHQKITAQWKPAEVGFALSLPQTILSPTLFDSPEARRFRLDNDSFLTSRESVEVSWQSGKDGKLPSSKEKSVSSSEAVMTEAQFRFLLADSQQGAVARFLQDQLKLLIWYRKTREAEVIFGAQLKLAEVIDRLQGSLQPASDLMKEEIAVVLLDSDRKARGRFPETFQAGNKSPTAKAAIGDVLPHWEIVVYPLNPLTISNQGRLLRTTLILLVAVLLVAIGVGSWLISRDLGRQLRLARQKTDFVSNVSHEFKTPLTSIRMFSELLQEGAIDDPAKARDYSRIICQESARLSRLIHQVLDFAAMERGAQPYRLLQTDLVPILKQVAESIGSSLEKTGFKLSLKTPEGPAWIKADSDAVAQVLMNLLSNAEKYSSGGGEIGLHLERAGKFWEVSVLDRGPGIPAGEEEKVFEQFYRGDDSLSGGIPGSGLGLTLARQIACAHQGELIYRPRQGGGSQFILRLPVAEVDQLISA